MMLCLLLLICVGVAEGRKNHVRCSSSCGHLHDIRYPFRLKGDMPQCGSPGYEILCDGGKPMLELGPTKYYVTNISYTNQTISVVDPVFVDDDKYCLLPLQSPPPDNSGLYIYLVEYWVLFVNCTKQLVPDGRYQRVPCLSSNNSFVYVYEVFGTSVDLIEPSCGFLASVPMPLGNFTIPITTDIFELLKEGFVLFLEGPDTASTRIHTCLKDAKSRVSIDIVEKFIRDQQMLSPKRYSYTDIIAITGHFREKLGQGGFGSVFRGILLNGKYVAIKMLGKSQFNGEDFINEVSTIGRIHHVNIVQLIGFCSEGSKRALVYEYMPKGSLDKYIFSTKGTNSRPFSWDKINEIALGVARGIDYLHQGCDMQILHFDIKPHNILLDNHFNPKVSDFGLAKLYPKDYSLVSLSVARGTIGYIAPELVSRNFGIVSDKSDVYSFGMLLLEMAGGRRNVDRTIENTSQVYYPSWIYDQLTQDNEIIEINNNIEIHEIEKKLCKVGLWCIQMKSSNRPSIDKVVEMLEGDTDNLQMPPRPFFASSQPTSARQFSMQSTPTELSVISEQEDCSNSDK
uniref:Protein kinase domain-containing protein n=1 Tax=Ananas comosus var. bracteatus TaxID=296719 RepID=A0A6V7Q5A7_ANACO|nr:unnamed protein product [Ananas comosus var. bracteatus]